MRKLSIVVAALLVLMVATMVTAVLSLNRLIAGQHDRIIAQARAALGREVAVGRISVSLRGGIAVRLDDVRIADDPRFGNEDFVRVVAFNAHAKLWPLLRQRFEVGRVVATQPHINLIRDTNGEWNYSTLRPLAVRAAALPDGIVRVANAPAANADAGERPKFVIHDAVIADGALAITDRTQAPVRAARVTQLDATIHYTDPTTPVALRLAAAVAADTRNVDVRGAVGPWDDATGLPLQFDGTLGPLAPANVGIEALHVVATLTTAQVHVSELTGQTLGGTFTLSGDYPLRPAGPIAVKGTVRDLDLTEAITAASGSPSRIGGKAQLIVDLGATGTAREAIAASLAGRLVADVRDGVIRNLNLANEVLGKAGRLPVVGTVVSEKIKPKYPQLFNDPDTRFATLHGAFTIGEQRAQTDDLTIATAEYGVLGRGWIGFNRQIDMAGRLLMSKRFSDDIVADVHAAKYLLDDNAQLALPFHLRGELGKAKPNLDSDDIMTLVQRGAAHGGAKDLLDTFLGSKPQATPGARKNPIEEGLRHLFGR